MGNRNMWLANLKRMENNRYSVLDVHTDKRIQTQEESPEGGTKLRWRAGQEEEEEVRKYATVHCMKWDVTWLDDGAGCPTVMRHRGTGT